ncbi:ATP-binding protein [Peribacillus asahii]|uniref:hybrid sensor histidine kinase/response regulator n=1 Tax=Peribacillus asahii TaxID=228899 RepID=UPI00381BE3EB
MISVEDLLRESREIMKKWFAFVFSISLIIILVLMIANRPFPSSETPVVKNGVLDARNWDFNKRGVIALDGDWEFVSNELLTPKDFVENREIKNQLVPGPWQGNIHVGTYRVTILLPDHFNQYGLRVRNIWSAHTVYLNKEKASKQGIPNVTNQGTIQRNVPYEIFGTVESNKVEIVVAVANYSNIDGGIRRGIDFGTERAIMEAVHFDRKMEWAATILLVIFSLYHFFIFLVRQKEIMFFYSGVYFASLALMTAVRNERILIRAYPDLPFELVFKLQDIVTYGNGVLLILFLIKVEPKLISRKFISILLIPAILYILSFVVLPARSTSMIQNEVMLYLVLLWLGLFIRLIWMAIKQQSTMYRNEAWILSGAVLFLIIFAIAGGGDALNIKGLIIFNRLGLLGFVIMMNIFLAVRLNNRSEEAENLTVSLQNSNAIKDNFLAVTARELKTPLHGIINIIQSILENEEIHGTRKQTEQLMLVKQSAEKLNLLVNDLKSFIKMRHNDLQLTKSIIDLRVMTDVVFELLAFDYIQKHILIENLIPPNVYVIGDEERFRQVVYSVLHNAIKFTEKGKVVVNADVKDHHVVMYVEDTGVGISSDLISDIFQFVYSENVNSVPYQHRGMGMGLYISKELMNKMNGRIWIERSVVGEGTVIGVQLPIAENQESRVTYENNLLPMERGLLEHAASKIGSEKVLIVDDDAVNSAVLRTILQDYYTPIQVFSGVQALETLSNDSEIKYVIIDLMMPGMSGVELTRKIRERYSLMELPIIISTVLDSPRDVSMVFQAGANDYITKPFTRETVLTRLNVIQAIRNSLKQALTHEMAFLQTQIKPHFLYNTLSSIISCCYIDGEKAAHLLTMLSSYLRYILEAGRDGHLTTLQQEMDMIHAYVTIEQSRFGEQLSFSCELAESLLPNQVFIPSLLIQPLVENSIRHGLFNKEGFGTVTLSIKEDSDSYYFQIEDDGVGMSEEQLKKVHSDHYKGNGIGLNNVKRRIRQLAGASFLIESTEGRGTAITIILPKNSL